MASFPGAIVTDNKLRIAVNAQSLSSPMLAVAMGSADTSFTLNNATGVVANSVVTIDNEHIAVYSVAGNVCQIGVASAGNADGRGFDNTAAAAHASGAAVSLNVDAYFHRALASEVKAIETSLGVGMGNVAIFPASTALQRLRRKANVAGTVYEFASPAQAVSTDYNFPAQTPGGSLGIGSNTITLTPVPLGVNAANPGHALYISGGAGAAEAALITGGTAVSGASTGTVIVTCANTHSGAWTVTSATAGIREALAAGIDSSGRGSVYVPGGFYTIHGSLYIPPNHNFTLRVDGELSFPDTAAYDGIWIDSSRTGRKEFNGAIAYAGSQNAVKIYGLNPDPLDGINQVDGEIISFTNITASVNTFSGTPVCQRVLYLLGANNATGYGNVSHNRITATSLTGGLKALVLEPAAIGDRGWVQENQEISVSQIVYFQDYGVYISDGAGLANNNPVMAFGVLWPGPVRTGIGLYIGDTGQSNLFRIGNIDTTTNAIQFHGGAGGNRVDLGSYGGAIVSAAQTNNSVNVNVIATQVTIAVGASPFVWNNPYPCDVWVALNGGAVSNTQVSADRTLYYNAGTVNAIFYVPIGGAMKITHTGAPNMNVFVKK